MPEMTDDECIAAAALLDARFADFGDTAIEEHRFACCNEHEWFNVPSCHVSRRTKGEAARQFLFRRGILQR